MKTILVDPQRCLGCRQCEIACGVEHSESRNLFSAIREQPAPRPRLHVQAGPCQTSFPNKCRHCSPAPCVQICPSGALSRDEATGAVTVTAEKCIACAMCAMLCPFDVITFETAPAGGRHRLVSTKCDNCLPRQRSSQAPACVEACKAGALAFGEINDLLRGRRRQLAERLSLAVREQAAELTPLPRNMQMLREWQRIAYELARG